MKDLVESKWRECYEFSFGNDDVSPEMVTWLRRMFYSGSLITLGAIAQRLKENPRDRPTLGELMASISEEHLVFANKLKEIIKEE